MEFKMQEKKYVQEKFSITEEQLDVAIKRMIKRHPLEKWIQNRVEVNGEKNCYLRLEFVNWLEEVYFNKREYYLDLEIKFFEKQISRLEKELGISPRVIEYYDMPLKRLRNYFDKGKNAIGVAVNRMCKKVGVNCKYIEDGVVMISKEGVKWLNEKYFREAYLNDLEIYKIELQKKKRILYEYAR